MAGNFNICEVDHFLIPEKPGQLTGQKAGFSA